MTLPIEKIVRKRREERGKSFYDDIAGASGDKDYEGS